MYREQLARVLEDARVKNAMLLEAQRQVRSTYNSVTLSVLTATTDVISFSVDRKSVV